LPKLDWRKEGSILYLSGLEGRQTRCGCLTHAQ
jgi:hypothetical protein